jgi:hypothetical protein
MVLRRAQNQRRGPARCTLPPDGLLPLRLSPAFESAPGRSHTTRQCLLASEHKSVVVFRLHRCTSVGQRSAATPLQALPDGERRFVCHIASTA